MSDQAEAEGNGKFSHEGYWSFDQELEQFPFCIGVKWYVLKEMDGEARKTFKSKQSSRVRVSGNQFAGFRDAGEMDLELLELCVFEAEVEHVDGKQVRIKSIGNPVPGSMLRKWRASIVSKLHAKAERMNCLEADAKEEAKNS